MKHKGELCGGEQSERTSKDPENHEVKRQEDQGHMTGLGSRAGVPEVMALATEGAWSKDKVVHSLCVGQVLRYIRWTEWKRDPMTKASWEVLSQGN